MIVRLNGETGASAVEMAIITALLMLLMLGGIDLGLYFYNKHILTWGSREAARWGVVVDINSGPSELYRRTLPSIESYARAYYNDHLIPGGSGDEVNFNPPVERTYSDGVSACTVPTADDPCLLKIVATYDYNLFFASFLGIDMPDLVAVSKMRME